MVAQFCCWRLFPCALLAQQNFDTVTVRAQALRGGVYMLTGAGGNIGLSVGRRRRLSRSTTSTRR